MTTWPELAEFYFVSGRLATEEDINKGAAVFLLQVEGERVGKPLDIAIPQYAIHTDEETSKKSKMIIIQAEENNSQHVIGAVDLEENVYMAGLLHEFTLLGQEKPNE